MHEATLNAWRGRFDEWAATAKTLIPAGKAKEAFAKYPWYSEPGDPFQKMTKPAAQTRFGMVTTGGYSIAGSQEPMRGYPTFADEVPQIRMIPTNVDRAKLKINHPGYDHKYAEEDINCNLPFDRIQELIDEQVIGSFASNTAVLMGLQPNVGPLLKETIPTLIQQFKADGVEAVLLVPS